MALCVLANGLKQILARLSSDSVGQRRGDWFPIGPRAGDGRQLAFPDHLELRFAIEFGRVARGREAIRLPGETSETKRGFNRRGQCLAVQPHRDEFDGQRGALLKDCVEMAKAEIKIRTVLNKGAGFGDGLLAEVGNFAEQLGRARLRRFWIYRQWRCDFREATRVEVRFSLRVELGDKIERATQSNIFGPITECKVIETFRFEGIISRDE